MSLINPFLLLGLDVHKHINLKEVRKTYHSLALLTHPDKGGNQKDFLIIHQAYQYVTEQVEQSKEMVPLEKLEEDFKNFCKENKVEKLPSLLDIRDNAAVFNQKFNEVWNENSIQNTNFNHFADGYGNLMDNSENVMDNNPNNNDIPLTNEFTRDLMIYEEPNALPENYGEYQRYDVDHVDNYGNLPEHLYDYKETYSQVKDKKVEDIKIEDEPMTDFEKRLQERQQERDNFNQTMPIYSTISLYSKDEEVEEI